MFHHRFYATLSGLYSKHGAGDSLPVEVRLFTTNGRSPFAGICLEIFITPANAEDRKEPFEPFSICLDFAGTASLRALTRVMLRVMGP